MGCDGQEAQALTWEAGPTIWVDLTLSSNGEVTTTSFSSRASGLYRERSTGKFREAKVSGSAAVGGSGIDIAGFTGSPGTNTSGSIMFGTRYDVIVHGAPIAL